MVTAGKNQESISVFKDMYGIFKIREKIEDNCSHHGHKKPTPNQSKTALKFKRKTQIKKLRKSIERKTEGMESVESLNSKKLEFEKRMPSQAEFMVVDSQETDDIVKKIRHGQRKLNNPSVTNSKIISINTSANLKNLVEDDKSGLNQKFKTLNLGNYSSREDI